MGFFYGFFGEYSEFATRITTAISYFLMGLLVYYFTRKYISRTQAVYSSLFFLISVHTYFYESLLAEIDIFYSLITFCGLLTIFHFYQKQQFFLLFTTTYFLHALGTLSKGFPSILFLGISLAVYFYAKKDFRKLFSWSHLAGILIYVFIIGFYFILYAQFNSITDYFNGLWGQSREMTIIDNRGIKLFSHVLSYPFSVLKDNLPAAIFLLLLIRKDFLRILRSNELLLFSALIFAANILVYWFSPKSAPRYTVMLNPFVIIILVYFAIHYLPEKPVIRKILEWFMGAVILIAALACLFLLAIPQLQVVEWLAIKSWVTGTLILSLFYLFLRRSSWRMLLFISTFVLMRILFDLTVSPLRASVTDAQNDKKTAYEIAELTSNSDLFVFGDTQFSQTIYFYIEQQRKEILSRNNAILQNGWFLAEEEMVINIPYQPYMRFDYRGKPILLIKFD